MQLVVQVVGDTLDEFDETFFMNLSNAPDGSTVPFAKAQGTCTILDDDPPPNISINNVSVNEGNSGTTVALFTVILSRLSGKPISVDFATADGSATAGSDYVAASGTLIFNVGELTKSIAVTVNGDTIIEPDETFFVNLTNPQNVTFFNTQGIRTIVDDDLHSIQFSSASYSVNEGDGRVNFTLSRGGDPTSSASVNFSTYDASCLSNCIDFNPY